MTITLELDEATAKALEAKAKSLGISIEETAIQQLSESNNRQQEFDRIAKYVLDKNTDLYHRLAQ